MEGFNNTDLSEHRQFRLKHKKLIIVFSLLAVIIAVIVFWWLKLTGITITSEAFCGLEEHIHTDECYSTELICGFYDNQFSGNFTEEASVSDSEQSTSEKAAESIQATDETKATQNSPTETAAVSEKTIDENTTAQIHIHTDTCYKQTLICDITGHTHSTDCFPDPDADKETPGDWLAALEDITLTNNAGDNLIAVASTQKGYHESVRNFQFDNSGIKHSYTRYGEWYGSPYAEWNTLFTSFCIRYADINNSEDLQKATAESMMSAWQQRHVFSSADTYEVHRGDIVFFDTDSDGKADRTGIAAGGSKSNLIVLEGDINGAVDSIIYNNLSTVIGYGKTSELYTATYTEEATTEETVTENKKNNQTYKDEELTGLVNNIIIADNDYSESEKKANDKKITTKEAEEPPTNSQSFFEPVLHNSDSPAMFSTPRASITYTSDLSGELVNAVFKEENGDIIENGDTIYIGQSYVVALEFSEINTGNQWLQFEYNEEGYLTYQIPENIHCDPFTEWHPISARTESGTVKDVGEYFVDENGLLKVKFFNNENGVNFIDQYANVDFSIDFNATITSTQSGSSTDVIFNDEIKVVLNVDGNAAMTVSKSHGTYDSSTNTMDYTIRVEATQGMVKDLIIDDQIWENHYTLRDTIIVTDLEGNVLNPQPVISNHPSHNSGAEEGFRISGFPDFQKGEGYLISYKTQIYDYLLGNDTVDMWNGLDSYAKSPNGNDIYVWSDDWLKVELDKIEKDGKQSVLTDANGNTVPVIEWEIEIKKSNSNLQGTVVVDTLGEGLSYYTGEKIRVKCYDENGNRLEDQYISWDEVSVNGNSMEFDLPYGYRFVIVYYTEYENLTTGETKEYTNEAKVTINGKEESAGGSADVVGFIPRISKSASGNDGEYVYFTIEADVPGVIQNWGNFYLTDLAAFWSYDENDEGFLYVENVPRDMVITAVTESGRTINFTPYTQGGTIENTFILVTPSLENGHHSFNVLFNTSEVSLDSSKWILDENAVLTISYKIPFDAKTGVEWEGELSGPLTLESVLLAGHKMANEAYLNYTDVIDVTGVANYEYTPTIIKKSVVNDDGTIDYTVVFYNTIPGSGGDDGYITAAVDKLWFNDTFDERLEYVPGSLMVTGYSPWQKDLWLAKFVYTGSVTGNTIRVLAEDLVFYDYNEEANYHGWYGLSGADNFKDYYSWVNHGGRFEFTYKLKIKDEYYYTTEENVFVFDNTAELTWDADGSSGPVTDKAYFKTGLAEKHVVQENTKLDFDIHINRNALDILPGTDTLTIEDTMTDNLSVYWNTILLLYEDENGNWIDFSSEESEYTYTVTYDPPNNKLTFVVPDSLHMRIDYTTLITQTGLVSVNNSVHIEGKAQVSDVIDAIFRVEEHSGDASGSVHKTTLLKQDGNTDVPLPNAEFLLYGPMGDPDAVVPDGVSDTITTENGSTIHYIGRYTTGPDGTVIIETQYLTLGGPYAFVEHIPPAGYELPEKPTYFYFYEKDPDGIIQTITTLIAIENFAGGYILPETGSTGILPLATTGIILMSVPVLYSIIRRKRERRLN